MRIVLNRVLSLETDNYPEVPKMLLYRTKRYGIYAGAIALGLMVIFLLGLAMEKTNMTTELILLGIVVASLGALFLWVARSRSSSVSKESTDASHALWTRPDRCHDLCRQDSGRDFGACAIECSLLQD